MKNPKTGEVIDGKTTCGMYNPVLYDILLGEEVHGQKTVSPYDVLADYEAMDKEARWAFWKKEFGPFASVVTLAARPVRCATAIPALSIRVSPSGVTNHRSPMAI